MMVLSGAPGIFQRLMNHYLLKFLGDFILCYFIYINTYKKHLEHIHRVLEVLQEKK